MLVLGLLNKTSSQFKVMPAELRPDRFEVLLIGVELRESAGR